MLTKLFFPGVVGVRVERVWREDQSIHLTVVRTCGRARCPLSQRHSTRLHARYERTLADLPCIGARVLVPMRVRRVVWRVRWCRRKIFAERLPAIAAPFARRTTRLATHVRRAAFACGGAPGARHAAAESAPASVRTLLRLIRAAPVFAAAAVRVLGVDDWSRRKGRDFGAILVDLEARRVVDVLPDRTAATLASWLRLHPEVAVVSRDRAGADAECHLTHKLAALEA